MKHNQILRRGLGILLSLLMCLGLLPATATAATSYGFYILGTKVTSDNIDSLSGVSATVSGEAYSVSYDADTTTLTLKNVTIEGAVPTSSPYALLDCGTGVDVIKLEGRNVITGTEPSRIGNAGIYGIVTERSLTIEGQSRDDSLEVTVPQYDKILICVELMWAAMHPRSRFKTVRWMWSARVEPLEFRQRTQYFPAPTTIAAKTTLRS